MNTNPLRPIVMFYHNMKRDGVDITHDGERLKVKINNPALKQNPYVKEEITKRAALLAQILDMSGVPVELHQYMMVMLDKETAEMVIDINKHLGSVLAVHGIGGGFYLFYVGTRQQVVNNYIKEIKAA